MQNDLEHEYIDQSMSGRKKFVVSILCMVILAVTYFFSEMIIASGPKPKRKKPADLLTKVKVIPVEFKNKAIELELNGTVEASRLLSLKSELNGLIVEINPKVELGQRVKKGEVLFRLEKLDFESALANKKAALARAQMDLEVEKGRQSLSKREWDLIQLKNEASDQEKKLALREPQLMMALANIKSAKADVDLAAKNLQRTEIKAPFDALILGKNVEVGARISPQEVLVELAAAEPYWVRMTLAQDKIKWLKFRENDQKGSEVMIQSLNGIQKFKGEVLRYLPNIADSTRMAQVLVEVAPQSESPLLLGSYVKAIVKGKVLKQVVQVDRRQIKDGKYLHILDEQDQLEIKRVEFVPDGRDSILIISGLEKGDRLITSRIPVPVEGMKLKVLDFETIK